jgi:ribosome-associated protein
MPDLPKLAPARGLRIASRIVIAERELEEQFVRASGPGGQNVNKVSTAVQLRFNVVTSQSLPAPVRERLLTLSANRINAAGELVIMSQRFRTQARNRIDARERLIELIRSAAQPPVARRKTRPTAAARERRLTAKRRRSEIKRARASKADSG